MNVVLLLIATSVALYFLQTGAGCSSAPDPAQSHAEKIARGKYLVMVGGCNDCHSPKVFTPTGPVVDTTRLLSGYPAGTPTPDLPAGVLGPKAWGAITSNDMTIWVGPWGVSYAYNLTPDPGTGIGSYTEELFVKTLRTGKKMGMGRDILPPMPWQTIGQMTDDDLKAIYAYLKSLPPINNLIPDPVSPPELAAMLKTTR
jgi:mono/diheme cytochrome c family protein